MAKITEKLAPHSYNKQFVNCLEDIEKELGWEFFNLSGIGDQLDANYFGKQFFKSNVTADSSVDPNSNVSDKSVIAYHFEAHKPLETVNALYRLWKGLIKLKKSEYKESEKDLDIVEYKALMYANDVIKKQIKGDLYINDITGISTNRSYCFNYSTMDVANFGIPKEFDGEGTLPPKHLSTFFSQMLDFMIYAGNSTLGAVGVADLLLTTTVFFKKVLDIQGDDGVRFINEDDCWNYLDSKFEKFLYDVNKPNRSNQSMFSNVSIYDRNFLEDMCPNYRLEIYDQLFCADPDTVLKVQEVFINVFNREQKRRLMTFPVLTPCISLDKERDLQDENFLREILKANQEFNFMNLYGGQTSTLSSCCFGKDQYALIKSGNDVLLNTFENLYNNSHKDLTVYHNGSWNSAKLNKISKSSKKMFKVTTANHKELVVTEDHLHLTLNGDKATTDLNTSDYLAFSSRELHSYNEDHNKLTYSQGFLIGLCIGDNSKRNNENYSVTISLNEQHKNDLHYIEEALASWGIQEELHVNTENFVASVTIQSKELFNIINKYVKGKYDYEKEIDLIVLQESLDFRKGVLDGWYNSEDTTSSGIFTTSHKLVMAGEVLLNSIGKNTDIVMLGADIVHISRYSIGNERSVKDTYKVVNNTEYFKITDIEEVPYTDDYVYCFEMTDQSEPYFTLPNGVITHNCRLRSNKENKYMNTIGSGSVKIGSIGVCTINLPRISYSIKSIPEILKKVRELLEICQTITYVKRKNIKRAIDQGRLPLYSNGFININTQYNTVGVIGFNEFVENLGLDITTEEGEKLVLDVVDTLNTKNDEMSDKFGVPTNLEQIPGENVAIKLATKDRLLGYNDKYELYSNQFIPLVSGANLLDRIRLQAKFDRHFGGGSILHINVDEMNLTVDEQFELVKDMYKKGVIYFAFNNIIGVCNTCKSNTVQNRSDVTEDHKGKCKSCGSTDVDVAFRIVGFVRKVKNWAKERRAEFHNRKFYNISNQSGV